MFGIFNTKFQEYDQEDEERLVYEAGYQACREYTRHLDTENLEIYPLYEESEESEIVYQEELDYA